MVTVPLGIVFFETPAAFRRWLAKHHRTKEELWVGFFKVASGRASITWPESVDQALCFGWIDGVRRRVDDASYTIRFTPRRARSTWSVVNIRRAQALLDEGLLRPAGMEAFRARRENRSGLYSYEQRPSTFDEPSERRFRRQPAAWKFFQSCPPSYRRAAIWWVVSAKKEETRQRRLTTLIADSSAGRILRQAARPSKGG